MSATLVGIMLQPISAVGLWRDKRSGRGGLIIAAVLCFPTCSMAVWPVIVLAATPFRLDEAKTERRNASTLGEYTELRDNEPDA